MIPLQEASLSSPKIIIIEDNPDLLNVFYLTLKRAGYHVITADNGSLGLQMIQHERPDMVVMDLTIPGLSGLELCSKLQESSEMRDTPIVILTGASLSQARSVLFETGANIVLFLQKPVSPDRFLNQIQRVFANP
ncbi:response regulator [bacterium]|nr:MAG: response regulator [bacterium]